MPVLAGDEDERLIGTVSQLDLLKAHERLLVALGDLRVDA